MFQIFRKEIAQFFSSLTGYMIIGVFVMVTALFLWVIPGSWNIPMSGYASLDGLFDLAPWLFLFLVPAVTMGSFSEEFQSGTAELLFTRPVSRIQIVLAKYLAAVSLIAMAIVLTFIYYFTLSRLAVPVGNLDHGAICGSYLALFFLGAAYAAIGLYASAVQKNQVVSFMVALVLSFLVYSGFDLLAQVPFLESISSVLAYMGIEAHYGNFSKGLVDTSDLIYFLSIIMAFLSLTQYKIQKIK